MGSKLVTLSINMLDLRLVVVDAIPIPTVDEESSLSTGVVEGIGNVGHEVIWAVIEGEGNLVGYSASREDHSSTLEEGSYRSLVRNRFGFGYGMGKDGSNGEKKSQ